MFTLLSDIYHQVTLKEEYAILLLGLDNAGKSTLLESLKHHFPTTPASSSSTNGPASTLASKIAGVRPTIGQSIAKLQIDGVRFTVWDLGGQATLRELWTRYYAESHVVLYVIDSSLPSRVTESCRVLREQVLDHQDVRGVPVLMCANKQDLSGAMDVAELKLQIHDLLMRDQDEEDGDEEGKKGWGGDVLEEGLVPCCAVTGAGVQQVAEWIVTRVVRNKVARPPKFK